MWIERGVRQAIHRTVVHRDKELPCAHGARDECSRRDARATLGIGISILAPWTAKNEIKAGTLVALPLGKRKLKRRWGILHWECTAPG
ncbi:hypothetical protein LBMAG57_37140 [Verrucomicrobiota bacterium]|nr:hypothetical protein LBMAG57_37140 [Verrucomicrobiota bacterium]